MRTGRDRRRRAADDGFSLIEVLVAIVILTVGSLVLVGGSLFVTRDLVRSRQATVAAGVVQAKLDQLRVLAAGTTTPCTATQFASSSTASVTQGVHTSWVVPTTGIHRIVRVITSFDLGGGRSKTDTIAGGITC